MSLRFDHDELDRWTVKLDKATSAATGEVEKILGRGALNIKKAAQRKVRAGGIAHARRYPYTISYDVMKGLRGPVAEIGPDKRRRQGALGNLLEFGSVNNPPRPHMRPAADEELPRFEKAITDLAARLVEGQ